MCQLYNFLGGLRLSTLHPGMTGGPSGLLAKADLSARAVSSASLHLHPSRPLPSSARERGSARDFHLTKEQQQLLNTQHFPRDSALSTLTHSAQPCKAGVIMTRYIDEKTEAPKLIQGKAQAGIQAHLDHCTLLFLKIQ